MGIEEAVRAEYEKHGKECSGLAFSLECVSEAARRTLDAAKGDLEGFDYTLFLLAHIPFEEALECLYLAAERRIV